MQQEAVLHPTAIIDELKKNDVSHVVWLPDSETNFMYHMLQAEPTLTWCPCAVRGRPWPLPRACGLGERSLWP